MKQISSFFTMFIVTLSIFNLVAQESDALQVNSKYNSNYDFCQSQSYNFPIQTISEITGDAINENKFVFVYKYSKVENNQTNYYGGLSIGYISNNSEITYKGNYNFNRDYLSNFSICMMNDSTFILAYNYGYIPAYGALVIGKITNNDSIIFSSEKIISIYVAEHPRLLKLTPTKAILSYLDINTKDKGTLMIVNLVNNNTLNLGNKYQFLTNVNVSDICIDTLAQNKFVLTCASNTSQGNILVGTISSNNNISFSNNTIFDTSTYFVGSSNTIFKSVVVIDSNNFIITHAQIKSPFNCNVLNCKITNDNLSLGIDRTIAHQTWFISSLRFLANIFSVGVTNNGLWYDYVYIMQSNFPDINIIDSILFISSINKIIGLSNTKQLVLTLSFARLIELNNYESIPKYSISDNQKDINIYPNPTNGLINIATTNKDYEKIEIMNLTGKIVYYSNKNNSIIDLSSQAKGFYLVKVFYPYGKFIVKKIIVY
jgi:Secretion system C-terminal sorting domain